MTESYLKELVGKFADGTATHQEVEQLMNWYQSANIGQVQWPAHEPNEKDKVYARMLARLRMDVRKTTWHPVKIFRLKAAAILIAFIVLASVATFILKPFGKSYITISNPSGKIQLLNLPDNSRVWLNAATELRYAKNYSENRELQLDGEAYFEVTPNTKYPFRVKTGVTETIVVGTSFNIQAYKSDSTTIISVITGKVKFSRQNKDLAFITPDRQLAYYKNNNSYKITQSDSSSITAWKNGTLQFKGATLGQIANTLQRWYGITFEFAQPAMRNCRYYMSFNNNSPLEKILSAMSEVTGMQYTITKGTNIVLLSGKACE